jgi:hypothetical protein
MASASHQRQQSIPRHPDYVEAAAELCDELGGGAPAEAIRGGIRLALLAWQELGSTDAGWDGFGLDLLAADELLRFLPIAAIVCEPPDPTNPALRAAITGLLHAVADQLDQVSQDSSLSTANRLASDAAAGLVRRAVAVLP